jgi:hypothetical protein
MAQVLDCLVNFFGLDENEQPGYQRYFSYHLFAGPGPTPGSGVASITLLAVHDNAERCTFCKNFHPVESGGPAAALAAAIHYLDVYHERDHLRKVQSSIRGLQEDQPTDTVLSPGTPFPDSGENATRISGPLNYFRR